MTFVFSLHRSLRTGGLVMCAIAGASAFAAPGCHKLVHLRDAPPYQFRAEDGTIRGIHVDLVRTTLQRMQCEAEFVEMPWVRALAGVKAGSVDILQGAADIPERREFAYFSVPINQARSVVFIRRSLLSAYSGTTLASLLGTSFRLGVDRGASYGDEYDELLKTPAFQERLSWVVTNNSRWKMVAAGRLDGCIADELTGLSKIQELGLSQSIVRSSIVTSTEADFFAFSKVSNSEDFVRRFNVAFGTLKADGTYQRILERYLPCKVSAEKLGCVR